MQVDRAYKLLEAFKSQEVEGRACVAKQLADGTAWRESQELFELPVSEYTQLHRCQVGPLPLDEKQDRWLVLLLPLFL